MQGTVLALDLGTRTGFCVGTAEHSISGVWDLKPDRFSGAGMRFVRFRSKLEEMRAAFPIAQVVFEEVRRHLGTDAAHAYGGFMATLMAWCEEHNVPYEGVPVGTIKKHWAGNGSANKTRMVAECQRRGMAIVDDNEADAVALFDLKIGGGDG